MKNTDDRTVIRDLARRYAEIAALPEQEEKRKLWSDHFGLKHTRPPVRVWTSIWNAWCGEYWHKSKMKCKDPFIRGYEQTLRMAIFQHEVIDDDAVQEPWITLPATKKGSFAECWGLPMKMDGDVGVGGARAFHASIEDWKDAERVTATPHEIDEEATAKNVERLSDLIGDLLTINVDRSPLYIGACSDISTHLARMRGLEPLMMDMYDYPDELHKLLAFMRDGILANNQQAEDAGHYTLTAGVNQAECYANDLSRPAANSEPVKRSDIWGFCAAQEYTLVSPEFHDEFVFQYQLPIYEKYGLVHYGCCEDLTRKIDMLRPLKNLRSIAVAPRADVAVNAEQIGTDYAMSWRPNPTDMVCCGYDEDRVRKIIGEGLEACRGCYVHFNLKDIETVEGDITRLTRWTKLVKQMAEEWA